MLCCVGLGIGGWWIAAAVASSDVAAKQASPDVAARRATPAAVRLGLRLHHVSAEATPPLPLGAFLSPFAPMAMLSAGRLQADVASRTAFEGMRRGAAVALAKRDFHVGEPTWTPFRAAGGARVERYLGERGAAERLPNGKRVVVSSTVALRANNGSGLAPVSLSLRAEGGEYVPVNPLVAVAISSHASGGIAFADGLSVAPTSSQGAEAPVLVGNRLMFANAAPATDVIEEPLANGAAISWQLRSQESPRSEAIAFHLPPTGVLRSSQSMPGAVEALVGGRLQLLVAPASAVSADGSPVPASYSVSGNVLTTHVDSNGDVDFPVLVDPEVYVVNGSYGSVNGSGTWAGWHDALTSNFEFYEEPDLLEAISPHGGAYGSYGEIYIDAPGPQGKAGSAGITRVDLTGVSHSSEESDVQGQIAGSNGSEPIYSFNESILQDDSRAPLNTTQAFSGDAIAFCAQQGGGTNEDLCDEENDQGASFEADALNIVQPSTGGYNHVAFTGATVTYREPSPPNKVLIKHPGYEGQWLQSAPSNFQIEAESEGLGVGEWALEVPAGNPKGPYVKESLPCGPQNDFTGCATSLVTEALNLSGLNSTGVYELAPVAVGAAGFTARPAASVVKLDIEKTGPTIGELGGALGKAANGMVGSGNSTLDFSAVDGSGERWPEHAGSGVRTMEVKVDGTTVDSVSSSCGEPHGEPASGCFALSGEWTMNGAHYGVGTHAVKVVAKNWAGVESSRSFNVTVNEAPYEPLGPGAVNVQTGAYELSQPDVSIAAGTATLSVGRSYNSRQLDAAGPFGPEWQLALPDLPAGEEWQSLSALANGSVAAYTPSGKELVFALEAGKYGSPPGYQTDTLSEVSSNPVEYEISDTRGDYTRFAQPVGGGAFMPSKAGEALSAASGGLDKMSYTFKTEEGVSRPTEVLAPEPSEGACTKELVKGCRALTFEYASSTTAKGQAKSEWGRFKGRLATVLFTAWEPVKGEMAAPVAVADYEYDAQGRLRAEWDPRIAPALKTLYGYDSEGHLAALTSPGQETTAFVYGSVASEYARGRLLKVTQAPASAALWSGVMPEATVAPVLSGSPVVGNRMAVSEGKWSGAPVAYSYQWEDCTAGGEQCTPILGAVNANYTPASGDVGHTLRVSVTATNGGGAVAKQTGQSATVTLQGEKVEGESIAAGAGSTVEYDVPVSGSGAPYPLGAKEVEAWGQKKEEAPVEATAIFAPDEPQTWPASSYKRATIFYTDSVNRLVNTAYPTTSSSNAIATSEYNKYDDVTRTLSPDDRVKALEAGSKSAEQANLLDTEDTYSSDGTELVETLGPQRQVKLADGEQEYARRRTAFEYDQEAPEGGPYHLVTSTSEGAFVSGHNAEDVRTVKTSYSGQGGLGWKLHEPTSTTTSTGSQNLTATSVYEAGTGEVKETTTPAWRSASHVARSYAQFGSAGEGPAELSSPSAVTVEANGYVFVADTANNRVDEFAANGTFVKAFGWGVATGKEKLEVCTAECKAGLSGSGKGELSAPQGIAYDPANELLYVSDTGNNRIVNFTLAGKLGLNGFGEKGAGELQFNSPQGITAEPSGNLWIADRGNKRLEAVTDKGKYVAVAGVGQGEYEDVAVCSGKLYATDYAGERVDEVGTEGTETILKSFGWRSSENGRFEQVSRLACDPKTNDLYVTDQHANHIESWTTSGSYLETFGASGSGTNGQFKTPLGIAFSTGGTAYVADSANNRMQEITASNAAAHDTQTIYYTATANPEYPGCGSHPEWAGLPCQAQPAGQPETSGIPNLPVTTYTYNVWDEPLTTTDTVGSTERTTSLTYEAGGRLTESAITSSSKEDKSLPATKYVYNKETGTVKEQTAGGKTIKSEYNTLGQLTSYTDAEGNLTKYGYEGAKDFRLEEVSDGAGEPAASTDSYTYNATTGDLESVKDSGAGTFTATRDVEGNITSERYPNGLAANYTFNAAGEAIGLEYKKTTDCTGYCTWYSDTVVPSIHGQWGSQSASFTGQSFATESYSYDAFGRLTEVQETPVGQGCVTRLYAYDEDGNRTSQTTRQPGSKKECTSTGGTTETHTYDTADRLDEPEVSYDAFGNTTSLPAADAGGSPLTSAYYVNDTLLSQEQAGETTTYKLDPAGRVRETVSSGNTAATVTSHYAGPEQAPAWTTTSTGSWSRNVTGVAGGLAAVQTSGEGAMLQLADLHGDVIGTASTSEAESKLIPAKETTEYGVPKTSITSKYSWLGADQLPTELPTGVIDMGARAYIPQLGRFEQTDPQPGGSINAYAYTDNDPVNQADPTGESATYNYQAAETGNGAAGLPEAYGAPGAITPPPANLQAEAELAAHPPWDAATTYTTSAIVVAGIGGTAAAEAVYIDHTWKVSPTVAGSLGWSIAFGSSNIGQAGLGVARIPGWLAQVLNAATGGQLETYGAELMTASERAAPGTLVEINVWGSRRLGFKMDVSYWVVNDD
jgi:RHS repeat-associated protein